MKLLVLASATAWVLTAVASPAGAADLPRKAPATYAPPSYFTWTGFYVGAHLGWGWQDEDPSIVSCNCGAGLQLGGPPIPSYTGSGFLGGLQAGYNWQFAGPWVVGIEGEFAWTGMKGDTAWSENGEPHTLSTRVNSIGDIAGRLGYAFDQTLFYFKGGWAWERADYEHTHIMPTAVHDLTGDITRDGWLVGLGIEHAFLPNVTAKIEWNYIGFGSDVVTTTDGPHTAVFNVNSRANLVKAGINYKF
jgi:outer membrane immunogenic protein